MIVSCEQWLVRCVAGFLVLQQLTAVGAAICSATRYYIALWLTAKLASDQFSGTFAQTVAIVGIINFEMCAVSHPALCCHCSLWLPVVQRVCEAWVRSGRDRFRASDLLHSADDRRCCYTVHDRSGITTDCAWLTSVLVSCLHSRADDWSAVRAAAAQHIECVSAHPAQRRMLGRVGDMQNEPFSKRFRRRAIHSLLILGTASSLFLRGFA